MPNDTPNNIANNKTPDWQSQYDAFVLAGTAPSTRRAYERDIRYFWAWSQLAVQQPIHYPVSEDTVIRFILEHLGSMSTNVEIQLLQAGLRQRTGPLKIVTLRRYLSSLSIAHQEAGVPTPMVSEQIKLLLKRAKRSRAAERPTKKAAITREILEAMLATCDDSLRGVRDRAILSVGFASGGRRRSELASLQIENLQSVNSGYLLHIGKSKTDQAGEGMTVPVLGSAAHALRAWLVRSGLRTGPLFRGIWRNNSFSDGIKGWTINYIVKQRIKKIGLDAKIYGAHSLRAGFITEAARSGESLSDAMALSGHRCPEVAGGYYREATVLENPTGRMLVDK